MSDNIENIYPLTPLQQGILFHTLYSPGSGVFIDQIHFDLDLKQNQITAFKDYWGKLVERHQALRTAFIWRDVSQPAQVVKTKVELNWQTLSFSGLDQAQQERQFSQLLNQQRDIDFDFAHAPLMRHILVDLGSGRYRLLWTFHHLILDGWSVANLLNELKLQMTTSIKLPALPRAFADYIKFLNNKKIHQQNDESFWSNYLKDFTSTTRVQTQTKPNKQNYKLLQEDLIFDQRETDKLIEFARSHRLGLNTLFHAAWSWSLMSRTREKDVVYGTTFSGRDPELKGIENMVGVFINSLATRVTQNNNQPIGDWLQNLQTNLNKLSDYQHSALTEIKRFSELEPEQNLFESLIVVENYPTHSASEQESELFDNITHTEQSNYPYVLLILPGETIHLRMIVDGSLLSSTKCRQWLEQIHYFLTNVPKWMQRCLTEINLVPPQQILELVNTDSEAKLQYDIHKPIHKVIESKSPTTGIALIDQHGQTSFDELIQFSKSLAGHLIDRGTESGDLITIFLPRSSQCVKCMLGVLTSGAGYVILDPDNPAHRIKLNHRLILYSRSDTEHFMYLLCHHAFIDGWSTSVALNEFMEFYNQKGGIDCEYSKLKPPQFKDYLSWINSQKLDQACEFWLKLLSEHDSTRSSKTQLDNHISKQYVDSETLLDADLVSEIKSLCQGHNLTTSTLIQSAWAITLYSIYDTRKFSYNLTLSGRSAAIAQIEKLVGQLSTALPILVELGPEPSFIDFTNQIQKQNNQLRNYEFLSLAQLSEWGYSSNHNDAHIKVPDSLVVIENFVNIRQMPTKSNDTLRLINFESGVVSQYPFTLIALADDQRITIRLISNQRYLDSSMNFDTLSYFKNVLSAAIENPTINVKQLSLCSSVPILISSNASKPKPDQKTEAKHSYAPESETQAHLQKIWQNVLQTKNKVSIDDDFFTIGGNSLKALSLYSRIETHFGCTLPLATILEAPTIRQLSELIEDPFESQSRHIVKIQESGSQSPIFGIHAQDVLFYRDISAAIGNQQPFYAIQQLDEINGEHLRHDNFKNMAAMYIEEIKQIQAHGPYTLIGLCMGCTIGLEMAHQLSQSGEEIHSLIMIDPDIPEMVFPKKNISLLAGHNFRNLKATKRHFIFTLSELIKLPFFHPLMIAKGKLRIARKSLSGPLEKRRAERRLQNWIINQKYQLPDYSGKITLIQSSEYFESMNEFYANDFETSDRQQTIDNHVIKGSHTEIFSPPTVYKTAAIIQQALVANE